MERFFITGAGTDVGKTLLMTTLCWQMKQAGKKVTALKPVISGYDANDEFSDTALILKSCGLAPTPALMETISPWRFSAQLAPNLAAAKEGKKQVELGELVSYCRDHVDLSADMLLVEGVGGLMSPISDTVTVLDWMMELKWPVILVTGSYLGALSHTLTAAEVLKARGLHIRAVVVNQSLQSTVTLDETVGTLQKFLSKETLIVKLPRYDKEEPWKHMPLVSWMVNA